MIPDDDPFWGEMSDAVDHLAEEVSFGSDAAMLVYDPADARHLSDQLSLDNKPWLWVPTGSTKALLFDGSGEDEGPYVWVLRTSDGPLDVITIRNELFPVVGRADEYIGTIQSRSGSIGLAWPEVAREWGDDLRLDAGVDASVMTYRPRTAEEFPGMALAVQLPGAAECGVYVHRTDGRLVAIDIVLPRPGWAS